MPGSGKIENVELMFVGEAPGRNEDLDGKPFVGAGGKMLDKLLESAGLNKNEVYITNIVKCRPPNNRKPEKDEVNTCTTNYLENQIRLLKPRLICTLGATALEYFTGQKRMGDTHGKLTHAKNGTPLYPTYHPASVFRNQLIREFLRQDLEKIPKLLHMLRNEERQTQLTAF